LTKDVKVNKMLVDHKQRCGVKWISSIDGW